ncbi:MAG: zf-HC2 domain-containing protein [Clostridia bacterium]|nr:zf-HC2 domain-containing protein [Clostridia bacterium]
MDKNCNIIKDLLPLYAENLLSPESEELVKKHLDECEECRAELEGIKSSVNVHTPCEKAEKMKAFMLAMKKYKKLIIAIIYGWVLFATMVITGFETLDLFLNVALMIPFGAIGYVLLGKSAFYKVPLIIVGYSLMYFFLAGMIPLYGKTIGIITSILFYMLLFILPALLGIAAASSVHSIFKKRTKKIISKRIAAIILSLILVGSSLFIFFAFIGNPFIGFSSYINAMEYINERFEKSDYYPYKIRHDCVFEGTYIVYVKSFSNKDVNFQIKYTHKGKLQKCDYDEKYKSDDQTILSLKYARVIDNALNKSDFSYEIVKTNSYYYFPYEKSTSEIWINALKMEEFNVKDDYNLSALGKTNGAITVEVYSNRVNLAEAKKVYLELKYVLDELGIGFRTLRINIISTENNDKASFSSIRYEDITEEKIDGELERLTKYQEIK